MIDPTFVMKQGFFDRAAVQKAVDQSTRKAISSSLASVRGNMRKSLRRRKGPSKPGRPPSVHSKHPQVSLKKVLFAYDARTKSGVVGSVKLRYGGEAETTSGVALPGGFERGGTFEIRRKVKGKRGKVATGKFVKVAPRPYAGPALERSNSEGEILSPWANVVSG